MLLGINGLCGEARAFKRLGNRMAKALGLGQVNAREDVAEP